MSTKRRDGFPRLGALLWGTLALAAVSPRAARAELNPAPLRLLDHDRLRELSPLLRAGTLALLESSERGGMRQITTVSLAAAPPEVVRDVVAHPERYGEFVRNMTKSTAVAQKDGSLVHSYSISLSIETVWGRHIYRFPQAAPGEVGPVDMADADEPGVRHYRWEFLPAEGGTLIVVYGYTPIPDTGIMGKLLHRVPTLEYGLALMTQLTLVLAMKERAEKLAGGGVVLPASAPGQRTPSYQFMLDRGMVALLRTAGGRLTDISLIDRVRARPEVLMQVIGQPEQWAQFVPSITSSVPMPQPEGSIELEQSVPLMSWKTVFGLQKGRSALDMLGLSGDMRGARLRWDVRKDSTGRTELVLRTNQAFDRSSMILRQLYRVEPLMEYGVAVGLDLPVLWGIKSRAEQMSASAAIQQGAAALASDTAP